MESLPQTAGEEKQQLLPPTATEAESTVPSTATSDASGAPPKLQETAEHVVGAIEDTSEYNDKEAVTHYNSLSVNCQFRDSSNAIRGTARIVEHDVGGPDDFWNIHLDFIWRPRLTSSKDESSALKHSVDQLLILRIDTTPQEPVVTLYLRGGRLLGHFYFPNGPDAAMDFVTALRVHVDTIPVVESSTSSKLFVIEKKPRMRRVAPTLMNDTATEEEDGFASLLQDLDIQSATATQNSRRRQQGRTRSQTEQQDLGMNILSQFARITQAARDLGDDISLLIDEKKRRREAERKERERAARRRALDIYADIVASTNVERELPPRLTLDENRGIAVSLKVWEDSFDKTGTLKDPAAIKQAIFSGGVEDQARASLWPFILGVFPWESSREERSSSLERLEATYNGLKSQWQKLQAASHAEDEESLAGNAEATTIDRRKRVSKPHAIYLEIEDQIRKDIIRTDRSLDLFAQDDAPATLVMGILLNVYATYDNRINYCQGMSDFLSPLIHVLGVEQEALGFWCFESLMRRIERNFRIDQSGMRSQLGKLKRLIEAADTELANFFVESDPDYYSCFRWILVSFKREFSFEAIARLWEVLWTQQVGDDDLHIFVAGALLIAHRKQLLSLQRGAFDCLLRYINDMCMRIDVDFAIREGELCFRKYGKKVS